MAIKRVKTPEPEEYLSKEYDYSKLKKDQLRKILSEQGITIMENKLKAEILKTYKREVWKKIDKIKKKIESVKPNREGIDVVESEITNFSQENPFQSPKKEKKAREIEVESPPKRTPVRNVKSRTDLSQTPSRIQNIYHSFDVPKQVDAKKPRRVNLATSVGGDDKDSNFFYRTVKESIKRHLNRKEPWHNHDKSPSKSPIRNVQKTLFSPSDLKRPIRTENEGASRKWKVVSVFVLPLIAALVLYSKYFIPYCVNGGFFCVNPPKNALIESGKLKCAEGYVLQKNFIFPNKVVKDITQSKSPEEIVAYLRRVYTEFHYGLRKIKYVRLENLDMDLDLKKQVLAYDDIKMTHDGLFVSKRKVFSPGVLTRYLYRYYYKYIFMTFCIVFLAFYLWGVYKQHQTRNQSEKILEMLKLQKKNSTTFQINPFLFEAQVISHADIKVSDFKKVKRILDMNLDVKVFDMSVSGRTETAYEWIG